MKKTDVQNSTIQSLGFLLANKYFQMTLFVVMILLIENLSLNAQENLQISLNPEKVYNIKTEYAQQINCDFYIENKSEDTLNIHEIAIRIFDDENNLILQKNIAHQGISPSILTVPKRELIKDKPICVFNPFYSFNPDLQISRIDFKFTIRDNKHNLFEKKLSVHPKVFESKTKLELPSKDVCLIYDGNDFYSHHRRFDFTHLAAKMLGIKKQSNRYAYDFCPVNEYGEIYLNDGKTLKDWISFGKNIYATASGVIIESYNDAPDSEIGKISFDYREAMKNPKLMNGNYVIIDHGNGEFSHFMHMKKGSLKVKTGDKVYSSQILGQIGNSGDSYTPHLHYQLNDGTDIMNSHGIPTYFRNYQKIQGERSIKIAKGYLETGEYVKNIIPKQQFN